MLRLLNNCIKARKEAMLDFHYKLSKIILWPLCIIQIHAWVTWPDSYFRYCFRCGRAETCLDNAGKWKELNNE